MKTRMSFVACVVLLITGAFVAVRSDAKDKEAKQLTGLSVLFDASAAEFSALSKLLPMSMDENAKSIVRERLVFCVVLMQYCVEEGAMVKRERASDGFETVKVIKDWIQKPIDQVSKYPEWEKRESLMMNVLVKVSG